MLERASRLKQCPKLKAKVKPDVKHEKHSFFMMPTAAVAAKWMSHSSVVPRRPLTQAGDGTAVVSADGGSSKRRSSLTVCNECGRCYSSWRVPPTVRSNHADAPMPPAAMKMLLVRSGSVCLSVSCSSSLVFVTWLIVGSGNRHPDG